MIKKIALNDHIWDELGVNEVPQLLECFFENEDTDSDEYLNLMDQLSDSSVCSPALFLAVPYLIDYAISQDFRDAGNVWCDIGMCVADAMKSANIVPPNVYDMYLDALQYAEQVYPSILIANRALLAEQGQYYFATMFGFSRHPLCRIVLNNFFANDFVGESLVHCKNHHENDVAIYSDATIVPISKYKKKHGTTPVIPASLTDELPMHSQNPWISFAEQLSNLLCTNKNIPEEIKSHIEVSIEILKKGINSELPTRYAFSIMGSLLYWCGMEQFALRAFHAWDIICCETCGEYFCFADQWR